MALPLQRTFRFFLEFLHPLGQDVFVWIDKVRNFHVLLGSPAIDVGSPATIHASHGNPNAIVGPLDIARCTSPGEQQRGAKGRGGLQKRPASGM